MDELPTIFPGRTGQVITALQLLIIATSYSTETNPKTRAQYSKFSRVKENKSNSTWPSQIAMMIIYAPAFIVSAMLLGIYNVNPEIFPSPSVAGVFCTVHFAKRCMEVMFVHKYSGYTDKGTPCQISIYYTLLTLMIAYAGGRTDYDEFANKTMLGIGTSLFVVGIVGNFYHHYLLASLRSQGGSAKQYIAPKGGLFSYVATPHYLFELIGWLGIAVVANHINVYLLFLSMCSYLGGRAVAQNEFNRTKFDENDWPLDRKNIVPYVF